MVLVMAVATLCLIGVREFASLIRAWDDTLQESPQMRLHNLSRLISHIAVIVLLFGVGWELAALHNVVLNDNASNTVLSTSHVVARWCLLAGFFFLVFAGWVKLLA